MENEKSVVDTHEKAVQEIITRILLSVYFLFAISFVIYKVYYWFIIGAFPNMPKLNYVSIVALYILLQIVKGIEYFPKFYKEREVGEEEERFRSKSYMLHLFTKFSIPILLFILAYVIHMF